MSKIKIVTDTASDITLEQAEGLGIDIINFMLTIDGESYRELYDMDISTFYQRLEAAKDLPATSQITAFTFEEKYEEYLEQGYTDIIYVSINATGSATNQNAAMAKNQFYENHPDAAEKMQIHIVDSQNYTAVYGYPVRKAAEKCNAGASVSEILEYLENWFDQAAVYFIPMTLKYVKKSGRVSAAAAFAGELLGLKPLICIAHGENTVIEKIRGEKNVVPKMVAKITSVIKPGAPYIMLHGKDMKYCDMIAESLTKELGYPPVDKVQIGSAIAINAGPDLAAVITLEEKK